MIHLHLPPLVVDDAINDVYLTAGLVLVLLIFVPLGSARLPALRTRRNEEPLLLNSDTAAAFTSTLKKLPLAEPDLPRALKLSQLCLVASCVLLSADYATLLALGILDAAISTVQIVTSAAAMVVWALAAALVATELRNRRASGRALRLWLLLNLLRAILIAHRDVKAITRHTGPAAYEIAQLAGLLPSLFCGVIAAFQPDTPSARAYADDAPVSRAATDQSDAPCAQRKRNTEASASFASRLTFSWLSPLLVTGSRRALEHADLYELQLFDSTRTNARTLALAWQRQMASGGKSLFVALRQGFGLYFVMTGLCKLANDLMVFVTPMCINIIVEYIDTNEAGYSQGGILLVVLGMVLSQAVQSLALGQYFWRGFRLGLHVRTAVGQVVYTKSLALTSEQRGRFGVGAIVSYMQIDATKLADAAPYMHQIWSMPLQLGIGLTLLYNVLGGWWGFVGLGVMVMMMPLQIWIGRKQASFQKRIMGARDRRVKFMTEVLTGVRTLKLFAWEKPMLGELNSKRSAELSAMWRASLFSTVSTFLFGAMPVMVTIATFVLYGAMGQELTAAKAFSSLSIFNLMRFPLLGIPSTITRLIDISVSFRRLSTYLAAEEAEVKPLSADAPLEFDGYYRSLEPSPPSVPAVELVRCDFMWPAVKVDMQAARAQSAPPKDAGAARRADAEGQVTESELPPTLQGISVQCARGALVGISDPVGAGKSSLLAGLIDDIPRLVGRVCLRGTVAFCGQEPWIQNLTLRDNVLFGRPFDERSYARVIHACCLEPDLQQLPAGDMTEIGERGINLSGGQKARVALARACYMRADVYLLDDILSAVDAHVGMHLMTHCIQGLLRELGATVLLVTHHTHHLSACDQVILLDAKGDYRQGAPSSLTLPRAGSSAANLDRLDQQPEQPDRRAPSPDAKAPGPSQANGKAVATSEPARKVAAKSSSGGTAGGKGRRGSLVALEERERGVVKASVWSTYLKVFGYLHLALIVFFYTLSQVFQVSSSWWLTQWSADTWHTHGDPWLYIDVYVTLSLVAVSIIWVRVVIVALASLQAGRRLHNESLNAIISSPMSFFDTTPLGRIINRMSSDMQVVDVQLRMSTQQLGLCLWNIFGTVGVVCVSQWQIVFVIIPLSLLYYIVARYYRHSSRELQRLDSISKSPIYAAFTETLQGATTIRAFNAMPRFEAAAERSLDHNLKAGFCSAAANRWLGVRLEALGYTIVGSLATLTILTHDATAHGRRATSAGMAGLALSFSSTLVDFLNWTIRSYTSLETQMVNAERVLAYCELPPEEAAGPDGWPSAPPPRSWPAAGAIVFDRASLRYREGLPLVLDELSLRVAAGEKMGIVGRTGAGKSSIFVALFRLVELCAGSIAIDGVDTRRVPLKELRHRLGIIPQDPVLFSGTLRDNIDPFGEHGDDALWLTLEQCSLDGVTREHPDGLNRLIDARGANLSVGQRQLTCMCRALLKRSRVLVLDEVRVPLSPHPPHARDTACHTLHVLGQATASVDFDTDELIHNTLRTSLDGVTVRPERTYRRPAPPGFVCDARARTIGCGCCAGGVGRGERNGRGTGHRRVATLTGADDRASAAYGDALRHGGGDVCGQGRRARPASGAQGHCGLTIRTIVGAIAVRLRRTGVRAWQGG